MYTQRWPHRGGGVRPDTIPTLTSQQPPTTLAQHDTRCIAERQTSLPTVLLIILRYIGLMEEIMHHLRGVSEMIR